MPRRTKEEALATRSSILDAAESLFHDRGVTSTSLNDIAKAAGVTRGAIYWHFQDKVDLFDAMMQRVMLPLDDMHAALAGDAPVLPTLRRHLRLVFRRLAQDEQVRRVFEIATLKVEYTEVAGALCGHRNKMRSGYQHLLEQTLRRGQRTGELSTRYSARTLAIGLHALVSGLIQHWLIDPSAFDLQRVGNEVLDQHLATVSLHHGDTAQAAD